MKVIYNKIIPFKGFSAINLFGVLFARKEFKPVDHYVINHEMIHTRQMIETLFIGFYLIYLINFLILLVKKRKWMEAYHEVVFEKEAYYFQYHKHYLENRKCYYWINYL